MTMFLIMSLVVTMTMTNIIPRYLVMYLWKEACRQEGKNLFSQLLNLLSTGRERQIASKNF